MADLALGRTPIREAILRLAGEGWIETKPNRGAVVPAITIQGAKAVFEAIRLLELGLTSMAVNQNIDELLNVIRSANQLVKDMMTQTISCAWLMLTMSSLGLRLLC